MNPIIAMLMMKKQKEEISAEMLAQVMFRLDQIGITLDEREKMIFGAVCVATTDNIFSAVNEFKRGIKEEIIQELGIPVPRSRRSPFDDMFGENMPGGIVGIEAKGVEDLLEFLEKAFRLEDITKSEPKKQTDSEEVWKLQ